MYGLIRHVTRRFLLPANKLLVLASIFASLYSEDRSIPPGHIDGRLHLLMGSQQREVVDMHDQYRVI